MELEVYNLKGEKTGVFAVDPEALGGTPSPAFMHRVVVSYEANLRQGNACAKTRGEVAGSGRKPWKQKHTGRARAGSIRSPLWRKGGVTFGPKPRDYRMKLSRRERIVALRAAMRGKMQDGEVKVVESMELSDAKTRAVAGFLGKACPGGGTVMFVSSGTNEKWVRAARNIPKVSTLPLKDLNAYSVIKARGLVIEKAALESWLGGRGEA